MTLSFGLSTWPRSEIRWRKMFIFGWVFASEFLPCVIWLGWSFHDSPHYVSVCIDVIVVNTHIIVTIFLFLVFSFSARAISRLFPLYLHSIGYWNSFLQKWVILIRNVLRNFRNHLLWYEYFRHVFHGHINICRFLSYIPKYSLAYPLTIYSPLLPLTMLPYLTLVILPSSAPHYTPLVCPLTILPSSAPHYTPLICPSLYSPRLPPHYTPLVCPSLYSPRLPPHYTPPVRPSLYCPRLPPHYTPLVCVTNCTALTKCRTGIDQWCTRRAV